MIRKDIMSALTFFWLQVGKRANSKQKQGQMMADRPEENNLWEQPRTNHDAWLEEGDL